MPSPIPKPPDRRQRWGTAALQVHEGGRDLEPAEPPDPPSGMLKATREWWTALWQSPLADVWEASDLTALRRLAQLVDERERAYRAFRKERLVDGSQGQPRLNPLGKLVKDLDAEIRQLEDRFGLSPMARLRLGVQFGEARRSLEEMNRALDDADHDSEDADPRVVAAADAGTSGM